MKMSDGKCYIANSYPCNIRQLTYNNPW